MSKVLGYTVSIERSDATRKEIAYTHSADRADAIYGQYIGIAKRGSNIVKVMLTRHRDGARFSYSVRDGYKEEFRKSA